MAKPWSEVAESAGFKALPSEQQDAARQQYFNQQVAPRVPEDQRSAAWEQFSADVGAGRRSLPAGVAASSEGAGRGGLNPDLAGAIPAATAGSVARDVASGALQIGPTAVKGLADLTRLATGDHVGKGLSDSMEEGMQAIREAVGSERAAAQRAKFDRDMADPDVGVAQALLDNKGALADQVLPTLGSMILPVGVAGAAGKAATAGKAAQVARAIDEATVLARADKARQAATIGTTVAQNAADTYSTVRDAGGDQAHAYGAAAITAPITALAGKLTGGAAEAQAARMLSKQAVPAAAGHAALAVPKAMAKEGLQEAGEEAGQYVGESIGTDQPMDAGAAGKRLAVAGTLGAAMGGGVDVAAQTKERIARLRDGGDTAAADLLQQRFDQQQTAASVGKELEGMQAVAPELPFHGNPAFTNDYQALRMGGAKPAEAAARAGMTATVRLAAPQAGMSPKAADAILQAMADAPLDKVPAMVQRYVESLAKAGALPPGTPVAQVGRMLTGIRDAAMHAAVESVYAAPPAAAAEQDSPASTMDAIQALEQQQQQDVPGSDPAAPEAAESGTENVPPVPGNVPVVPPADDPVHAAATSPHNDLPEPTQAQKDAGNYKVGRMRIAGMDLSIENPQGSVRRGVDADGKPWETPMQHHYGYIRGTTATDGDKLDVFVVPGTPSDYKGPVFVVDQVDPATGKLDEHKVVLGAKDEADAEQIYRSNYTSDWQGLGAMTRLPMPAFKAWAASGSKKEPLGELPAPPAAQPQPDLSGAHPAHLLSAAQNPTHPLTDAAAAELRRRETEHAYRQREAQVVQERGLIVDEARDQQADQAAATGRAQELEAPTAMAEALARAKPLKSKKAPAPSVTAEPVVSAAPAPLTAAERRDQARAERAAAENPMRTFLGRHGIALTVRRDFAPGRTEQRQAMVGRFGPIFRRSGLEVDQLAQRAVEEGFLLQPDVQQLESLIERALSGERVVPLYAPGAAEAEMEARIARRREMEEDAAATAVADLDGADLHDLWDASNSNTSTEDMLRALGASEEEIRHVTAEETATPRESPESRQGHGPAGAGGAQSRAENRDAAPGPPAARRGQAPLNSENPADAGFSDFGGDDFDPLFSRGEANARRGGADMAGKVQAAEAEVRKLTAGWKSGPQVTVVATPADLPVPAPADVKGLYLAGKAYIVASTQQPFMIARTLAHEVVAHYGLRAVLGQDGFKRLMSTMQMALASGNKPLREIRDDVRRLYVDEGGRFNLTPAQEADEIAALAVERAVDPKTGQFRTGMSWLKQTWARVADFLRQHGINVPFSVAELHGMLAASFENIRGGQRLQGADRMLVAASRGEADPAHLDGTEIAGELPSVELRKEVMSWAEEHLIGRSIINADTDASIAITRQGIKHGINGANEPELRLIAALPHLLRTAKLAEQVPDKLGRDHIKAVYRYAAHAVLRGEPMEVGIVVREGADGHRYYDHFILQKQTPAGQSVPRSPMEQPNAGVASPTGVPEAASGGQDSGTRKLGDQPASGDGRIVGSEKKSSNSPDTGSFSRGGDSQAPWQPPEASGVDRVIYELQDGRVDLKRTQEAISAAGRAIDERFDARLAETLYPGRVARRSEQFLDGEVKPLLEQMARNKVSMDELADYLHARGAPERNAQIAKVNPDMPDGGAGTNTQGVLMTDAAAATHLAGLAPMRRAVLAKLAEQVDAVTAGTRTLLVAEGLEKQETIDAWQAAYKHYVPMFRDEAQSGAPHPQGAGFSVRGSATKRATGSKKEVTNILAHVLMQREAAITRAEKNRVAVSLYGLALTNPNPDFWTTIRPGMQAEQIAQELDAMGIDKTVAEAGMRGVPTIRSVDPITDTVVDRPNPIYKSMPGALTLKVNGEDRVLLLNEKDERALRMAESMKNLDGLTRFDVAGTLVGQSTRWMAASNTQYNPAFGLVNVVRDTLGGSINLESTPLKGQQAKVLANTFLAMQGIGRDLAGRGRASKWAKLWNEFQDDGGRTGYRDMFRDANDRSRVIEKQLAAAERAGKLTPGVAGHAVLELLDGFNTTLENAVRVSAYKAALDHGLSRNEAARLARELTVDFNRKGRATRELGPLYAFFNASVQGSARTLQVLKGRTGAKIVAGGFALGVLQALMLAAAGYDDDEIPEFVKTRALIVPLPASSAEKRYVAVPLPLGLHVIPNTGRVIAELVLNGGKDIAQRTVDAVGEIAGAFNPLGGGNVFTADGAIRTVMPTIADPVVELGFNKNFAGRQIERETRGETDVRPGHERARESTLRTTTGQAYLGISKAINTLTGGTAYEAGIASPTPERVQYIAQVAGGGLLREFEKIVNGASAATAGEKVPASRIPVAGRFYGEVDDDAVQRARYFEAGRKLDKVQAALKAAQKAGDMDAVSRMLADHPELAMARAQDRVQTAIAKLNRIAVTTVGDREMLQQVDQARLLQMRALNDAMRELEKSTSKPTLAQRFKGGRSPDALAANPAAAAD